MPALPAVAESNSVVAYIQLVVYASPEQYIKLYNAKQQQVVV